MSIGIDFILRAVTTGFTKGMASANNSIKDIKKSLREFDAGNGLKQALGVGGIIAGFRMAITNAQQLRDEADKVGKSLDGGTRSVAEFGDALGRIGTGFKNALTDGLSFFTGIGDKARHFFTGVTQGQEDAARKMMLVTGKAADEAEARLKRSQQDNSPEKKQAAAEKLAKAEAESQMKGTEREKALQRLYRERRELQDKLAKTPGATTEATSLRAAIKENENAQKKWVQDELVTMDKENADKKKKEIDANRAAGMPSVEDLAAMSTGGFTDVNDPRLKARQILQTEEQAKAAFGRLDFRTGMDLSQKAQGMRKEFEPTNAKLDELINAVKGIIKAQP